MPLRARSSAVSVHVAAVRSPLRARRAKRSVSLPEALTIRTLSSPRCISSQITRSHGITMRIACLATDDFRPEGRIASQIEFIRGAISLLKRQPLALVPGTSATLPGGLYMSAFGGFADEP